MLLIQNGRPVPELLTLARKCDIDVDDNVSPQDLSQAMQETWLQKGKLRYQVVGDPPEGEDKQLLQRLGFFDDISPPFRYKWEGVLLLGALHAAVVSRLHYLLTLPDYIRFDKLYLWGGARLLDPVKESSEALCAQTMIYFKPGWVPPEKMPTTEGEMMEFVWQRSYVPEWDYELVNAPMQPKEGGGTRPPNTGDTANEFLKHNPAPGAYLVISHNPYIMYQELTIRRNLPAEFDVVGCGHKSSLVLPLKTYLDNIAKQLYEELKS